jgi:gluconokinase
VGVRFVEGDELHPAENREKMQRGTGLTDEDRLPWLERLHEIIKDAYEAGDSLVVACSALKAQHRRILVGGAAPRGSSMADYVQFMLLNIAPSTAKRRVEQRKAHFFPSSLVDSQFEALEITDECQCIDVEQADVAGEILSRLDARSS